MHTPQVIMAWLIFIVISHNGTHSFGYSKREQHLWSQKYELCAGNLQSPVAISTSKAVFFPFPALEMIGYHDFLPMPQILMNDGHTVKLSPDKNAICKRLPYIFGASLKPNQRYEMEQLHFHWGLKNNRGAEHILNGIRYPMEMHIVHRNTAYSNLSHALQREDGVAVIAVFFQLQHEDNELFQSFINMLSYVKWANTKLSVNMSIALASLIPPDTDCFYTYKGSLTTPPCNEGVTWLCFASPVPISFCQLNKFRQLSDGEKPLGDNYRELQDIGQRKMYARKLDPRLKDIHNNSQNFSNFSWFWL